MTTKTQTTSEPVLVLREHQTVEAAVLTVEQAELLARSAARVEVRPTVRFGRYDLTPSSVVGVVVLPGLRVMIRPKLPIDRVLYLLGYSRRTPVFGALTHLDADADLLDALVDQYALLLKKALSRGLVREYLPASDALPTLRGRADIIRLACDQFGLAPPIPCEYTEYTADTEVNRKLLAALQLLVRLTGSRGHASGLASLAGHFDEVASVRYHPARVGRARLDRRHDHVQPSVRLAELILSHMSVELRSGDIQVASFLIDMNALYEDFVVTAVGNALGLRSGAWVHHPRSLFLDREKTIKITPDALLRDDEGRARAILDAKYKISEHAPVEDVYQAVAYCVALRVPHALLVYASTNPDTHHVTNSGVTIHRVRLDPSASPAVLDARVRAVAAILEMMLG